MPAFSFVSELPCVVEGRLAKLEVKLAETQADLMALKGSGNDGTAAGSHRLLGSGEAAAAAAVVATAGDEDVVAMAVHLGLVVSSVDRMSAQQRWLVSAINSSALGPRVSHKERHLCLPSDKT
jgi:hypothetical protein